MKKIMSMGMLLVMAASLSACLVRTGPRHSHRGSHSRACPPSYHWNGAACVHNGRGRGPHRR
jgi:Flp pilus assembly protein TadD